MTLIVNCLMTNVSSKIAGYYVNKDLYHTVISYDD